MRHTMFSGIWDKNVSLNLDQKSKPRESQQQQHQQKANLSNYELCRLVRPQGKIEKKN